MIINLDKFIKREEVYWDQLKKTLNKFERSSQKEFTFEEIDEFFYLYRRAVSGLAKVRTFSIENQSLQELNNLVAHAHSYLHSLSQQKEKFNFFKWFFFDAPAAFRSKFNPFLFSCFVFLIGSLFGAGLFIIDANVKEYVIPFDHLNSTPSERVAKEMENKGNNISGHEATFSAQLMANNIRVSLLCVALGLTFGVGTVICLFYNGVILGVVCIDYILDGQVIFLLGWLLPHGVVEISAILLAGQLGFVIARTQFQKIKAHASKKDYVDGKYMKNILHIFFYLCLMLVWAGLVEAFLSQYHEPVLPYSFKIIFGLFELAILILLLSGLIEKFYQRRKEVIDEI